MEGRKQEVLSEAELNRRKDAADFAIANTELEGGTVLPEQRALFERHARGEISTEELDRGTLELVERLLKKAGRS